MKKLSTLIAILNFYGPAKPLFHTQMLNKKGVLYKVYLLCDIYSWKVP